MLSLGSALPAFDLPVVPGTGPTRLKDKELDNRPVLLMVLCAHCPFVIHVEDGLSQLDQDYSSRVQFLAMSSNSLITHPQDGPDQLAEQARKQNWSFPYLLDQEQTLAKDLKAACTPDFFLFSPGNGGKQELRYRGQLDGSRPGNELPVSCCDLRAALDAVLEGGTVNPEQRPSLGCNIKWHPGSEPDWFG